MSKGYAIAFILTTLSVFGSLFYLQHQVIHEQYRQLSASNAEVHDRVIAQQIEQQEDLVNRVDDRLQEDSKARFRPVQPFIADVQERQAACMQLYQQIMAADESNSSKLPDLAKQLSANLKETREAFARFLFAHGENMDLNKEQAMTIATDTKSICIAASTSITLLSAKHSGYETTALAGLQMTDYLQAEQRVLEMAGRLSGGKVIECGGYFPVFYADIVNPRKGETVRAKVSIGSYSTSLNPDNIILTAGSDTLTINRDGTADYQFTPRKRGSHTVGLHFSIRNPLTGEVKTGEGSYTYNVH
jgi:hypothetical protein